MGDEILTAEGLAIGERNGVLTIKFNRPAQRNSITYEMYDALSANLRRADDSSDIRCILITGEGSIFSAGHDVSGFARGLTMGVEEKPSFGFMLALSECSAPVIAALNGDAVGIGATMLFHCDFVYAVPGAKLVFPFMQMGLVPEFASTQILSAMIGHRRAMELFMLDGRVSVERAMEWGLVNFLAPPEGLIKRALETARTIASLSPHAVRETKRLVKVNAGPAIKTAIGDEAHAFHVLLQTDFVKDRLAKVRKDISGRNG